MQQQKKNPLLHLKFKGEKMLLLFKTNSASSSSSLLSKLIGPAPTVGRTAKQMLSRGNRWDSRLEISSTRLSHFNLDISEFGAPPEDWKDESCSGQSFTATPFHRRPGALGLTRFSQAGRYDGGAGEEMN